MPSRSKRVRNLARRNASRRWTLASVERLQSPVASSERSKAWSTSKHARVLGLDPGSLVTGYAVIDCVDGQVRYMTCGSIRTAGDELPNRLQKIFREISHIAAEWRPSEVAIERVFMHRNADSALKLGQARGAAICGALSASPAVFEYSAREVKQAVVGTGAAHKEQVQLMVKHLLKLTGMLQADAADALAIALCHAHSRGVQALLQGKGART